jgi:hypothetical protein
MKSKRIPFGADAFLSVLEGIEGGFAIFAGIVIGLSLEGVDRRLLIITAGISIIVNAFNASAVRYASEHFVDELDGRENTTWFRGYFMPAFIEFAVYAVASIVSIVPLLTIESTPIAIGAMTVITLAVLFASGWYRGNILMKRHRVRDGFEVAGLGLFIIFIGAASGWILSHLVA